jgi:group I intron endonuclease
MTAGVYIIRCKVTGKVYVGSSKNIQARWQGHKVSIKRGKHHSRKLQEDWNKYGENAFEFEIVKEVADGFMTVYEQLYINQYDSCTNGYNVLEKAGSYFVLPNRQNRRLECIVTLRITETLNEKLKQFPDKSEFCRDAITTALGRSTSSRKTTGIQFIKDAVAKAIREYNG